MPHPTPAVGRSARLAVAALALALGLGSAARAETLLRWKFTKGETLRYSMVQKTQRLLKFGDREGGQTIDQLSDIHWTVDEVTPEGVATMTQVIDRVRVKAEAPGQPAVEFDSGSDDKEKDKGNPLAPMFRAFAGFECKLTMDPRGQIVSVTIPEKSMEALKGGLAGAPANAIPTEETMKNMFSQAALILPEQPLEKGKGWTEQTKFPLPQAGEVTTDKTYTFEGEEASAPGLFKIVLNATMALETKDAQANVEIKDQKNQGDFVFDAAKGRIARSHVEVKMVQIITAGGNKLEATVTNTSDMSLAPEAKAE